MAFTTESDVVEYDPGQLSHIPTTCDAEKCLHESRGRVFQRDIPYLWTLFNAGSTTACGCFFEGRGTG